MYQIKVENFSGPLNLLLQLVEEQKVGITDFSLSAATDQYLKYLEKNKNIWPEELADFLIVAGRLLYLKSRALLPYLLEDDEESNDLEKQLKIYKEYLEASKKVEAMINKQDFLFSRERLPINTKIEFCPPKTITTIDLQVCFLTVLKKLDPLVKLPRQMVEKTISLQQKVLEIQAYLDKTKKFALKNFVKESSNRTEMIMNFLAVLELLKAARLRVKQTSAFGDIIIEKI